MGLFSSRAKPAPEPEPIRTDWSLIDNVRAEWPEYELDAGPDLAAWQQGKALYAARDDYGAMIESGALFCRALRHHLYGGGILMESDLFETANAVLYAASTAPPDGQSFPEHVAKQLRLALTVVKMHGWQSPDHGGDGQLAGLISARFMVFGNAVAPSHQRPWESKLGEFFSSNPVQPIADAPAAPTGGQGLPDIEPTRISIEEATETARQVLADAHRGDPAAEARRRGIAAGISGDLETAFVEFEIAAQLGDADAMYDAGCTANDLGRVPVAKYWLETAANAGHAGAAFNLGAMAYNGGQGAEAVRWWEQSAAGGLSDGYASLTQLADETGDAEGEFRWSRLGADAGHPFCQLRHGQLLMQRHPQDRSVYLGQAVPLLEKAADGGANGALFLIGIAHCQLGDLSTGRMWLKRSEAAGDSDATRVMRENGML